ncbi:hypothetical protein VSO92_08075 [Myroides pelagicus]|uniref:hypothetical protein n=1 Tax=Myroides pelagicus TaxID=270914 RepID=UPI002DC0109C|nr:hypothetical protein [Myroides pelagicus]MEC4114061.1 hypothetical protein [Myroides pelagicus]
MKNLYVFLLVILSHFVVAQDIPQVLDQEQYEEIVNNIGIYSGSISLKEAGEDVDVNDNLKNFSTIEHFEAEFEQALKENDKTQVLLKEFKALRGVKSESFKSIEFLSGEKRTSNLFNDKSYKSIVNFFEKGDRKENYGAKFDEIVRPIRDINSKAGNLSNEELIVENKKEVKSNKEETSQPKETSEKSKNVIGYFELKPLFTGILIGSVLGFLFFILLAKKFFSSKEKEKSPGNRPTTSQLDRNEREKENQIKQLKDEREKLSKERNDLASENSELKNELNTFKSSQSQIREKSKGVVSDPIGKVLYGSPDNKGGLKKEEDEEKSIYTIECKEDCTFYISIDGKYLGAAIFGIADYIDFACEYDVPPNSSTKGINVMEHGAVEKEGDGWRIIKKCKIEFV